MILNLRRSEFLSSGIFGALTDQDGKLSLVTAEHAYPKVDTTSQSTIYLPKISPSQYTCVRRHSPHFGYDLFWVMNVPNNNVDPNDTGKQFYDFIEIHIGNYPEIDSEGCVLLGMSKRSELEMITASKQAFNLFMDFLKDINTFELIVS